MYERNMFGRVPNSLKAIVPRWDEEESVTEQIETIKQRYERMSKKRTGTYA